MVDLYFQIEVIKEIIGMGLAIILAIICLFIWLSKR